MARRRRRSRKRTGFGRFLEGMAVLVLLIVILTFGFSIANRYAGERRGPTMDVFDPSSSDRGGLIPSADEPELPRNRIQLVVENGCGVDGLARQFSESIRSPRFDVVDYKDADRYDYLETTILTNDRGRQEAQVLLGVLAERHGVGEIQLTTETIYAADIRLILGADLGEKWDEPTNVP